LRLEVDRLTAAPSLLSSGVPAASGGAGVERLAPAGARIQLLYIASSSYSGSTLLTFLLATHPRIATVGELKATAMGDVERYPCSCGALIRACGHWRRITEELDRRGQAFDVARFGTDFRFETAGRLAQRALGADLRGRAFEAARACALRLLPGASAEFRGILERNRVLMETICGLRGNDVFLDGSKEPVRLKYLAGSGLWPTRVVHLVRDGRGVVVSMMKKRKNKTVYDSVERAALQWRRTNEGCERVLGSLPRASWVRVRYEDLCGDPARALGAILSLIGAQPHAIPEDFRSIDHHILGNLMRIRTDGRVHVDETWRSKLGASELLAFDRVAGELNHGYGYE
jgi:hypothetical protein